MLITEILQNSSFELKLIEQLITHLSKQLDDEKIMLNLKFLLSSSWISKMECMLHGDHPEPPDAGL